MRLKDIHKDIERYLLEDCYCPNEVYSIDSFFFVLVYADAECKLLGEYKDVIDGPNVYLVATEDSNKTPLLLNVWFNDDRVVAMERYELTEANIKNMREFWESGCENELVLTEMNKLSKQVSEILSIADAVLI